MALEINENTFFMVKVPGSKTIHQTENDAIDHLQANASDLNPESDDVSVVRVSVEDGDWTIAEMSWQNIALQMMGD